MREYERLKAEAEASAAISSDASVSMDKAAVSNSEVTSNSSAQDMGSESSFSDLPVSTSRLCPIDPSKTTAWIWSYMPQGKLLIFTSKYISSFLKVNFT